MEVVKMNENQKPKRKTDCLSCQALENEPLHSDFIMGMALAANGRSKRNKSKFSC